MRKVEVTHEATGHSREGRLLSEPEIGGRMRVLLDSQTDKARVWTTSVIKATRVEGTSLDGDVLVVTTENSVYGVYECGARSITELPSDKALAAAVADTVERERRTRRCDKGCCEDEYMMYLSEYEAHALKRLLERIGGAIRWKIPAGDQPARRLSDGDWAHQLYAKILKVLS